MSSISAAASVISILRHQFEPRERIDAATVEGVARALRYARENVPAYADPRYDIEVTGLADIARLPPLRKVDVLAAGVESFHSREYREKDVRVCTTSGTTGMMLEIWHNKDNYEHDRAANVQIGRASCRERV